MGELNQGVNKPDHWILVMTLCYLVNPLNQWLTTMHIRTSFLPYKVCTLCLGWCCSNWLLVCGVMKPYGRWSVTISKTVVRDM